MFQISHNKVLKNWWGGSPLLKVLSIHLCSGYQPIPSSRGPSSPFLLPLWAWSASISAPWVIRRACKHVSPIQTKRKENHENQLHFLPWPFLPSPIHPIFLFSGTAQTSLLRHLLSSSSLCVPHPTAIWLLLGDAVKVTTDLHVINSRGHLPACQLCWACFRVSPIAHSGPVPLSSPRSSIPVP